MTTFGNNDHVNGMKLYNLGKVPWEESQLIYHALAELGQEALALVSPATPYVCIGFHQDAEQEVDLEYCRGKGIPVFRREVGGGAVYLDGNQLFFQLILQKDNPEVPRNREVFYKKWVQPVINVYRHIGIPALFKPLNDVLVETRKISGTGAAEIRDTIVFVGNLIVDFDYETMSRVLKVPDEKFRDKIHKTLRENLSTIRRELGEDTAEYLDEDTLNNLLVTEFEKILGPLEASNKDDRLERKMRELSARMMKDEWLYRKGKRRVSGRDVKIRDGINIRHRVHKSPGGLIRADFEVIEGKFGVVSISGDFFCYPGDAIGWLESELEGHTTDGIAQVIGTFYTKYGIETPGIDVAVWVKVFTGT